MFDFHLRYQLDVGGRGIVPINPRHAVGGLASLMRMPEISFDAERFQDFAFRLAAEDDDEIKSVKRCRDLGRR